MFQLRIEYDEVGKSLLPRQQRWYNTIYRQCVKVVAGARKIDVTLILTDDSTVKQLNSSYRKHNRTTDVLSFYYGEDGSTGEGEVFISLPMAKVQAKRYAHSLSREIARLMIHGILHIYGFDHIKAADRAVMRPIEDAILKKCAMILDI